MVRFVRVDHRQKMTNQIKLKEAEEAVALSDDSNVALDGKTIPAGKYLLRVTTTLIPINEVPQP